MNGCTILCRFFLIFFILLVVPQLLFAQPGPEPGPLGGISVLLILAGGLLGWLKLRNNGNDQ